MIRKLVLRRFKQFEETPFDLAGNVVLAGQNNSGKTTVLQALSAWSLVLNEWKQLHDPHKHGGAYAKCPISRQSFNAVPLQSFDLLWRDRQYTGPLEIEVLLSTGHTLVMELINDSTEQIYARPAARTTPAALQSTTPEMIYVSSMDGMEIEEGAIHNPVLIQTLLRRQRPGSILRNLLLELSSTAHWDALCDSVKRLFGIELLIPSAPAGYIRCEFRHPGKSNTLEIMNAGSGLHQVLLLLACLQSRPESVLLIDEPDAHLHVFLQDSIFSEIQRIASGSRSQVILATHSEVIFKSVPHEKLLVMMGAPQRIGTVQQQAELATAMAILEQIDIVNARVASGVLYLEEYTDFNLLREWAIVLHHPAEHFFVRQPFWKAQVWESRRKAPGISAKEHFQALKLVRADLTGVWLQDSDGKGRDEVPRTEPAGGILNRVFWSRYEIESYLIHPQSLARYFDSHQIAGAEGIVRDFFVDQWGEESTEQFYSMPLDPAPLVRKYLETVKARTEFLDSLMQKAGVHGVSHTEFDMIAASMLPEEIHPEVVEKLNFIQRAFGL